MVRLSKINEVEALTKISTEAFHTDVTVGAKEMQGPPMYSSLEWHYEIQKMNVLYSIIEDDQLVGGMIIYPNSERKGMIEIGRIFIDPKFFRKGYGRKAMMEAEEMYKEAIGFNLETPIWNKRTNALYTSLGYKENKRDQDFIYYEKIK